VKLVLSKIITHPGGAHLDDILSTALVLARYSEIEYIERRDPTEKEINDPLIWILDIGRVYNPKIRAYDHHQKEWEECTISLLLKDWNLWEKAKFTYLWLEFIVIDDAFGPNRISEILGISMDTYLSLESPIENAIIDIFQNISIIQKGDPLFIVLREIGKIILKKIECFESILKQIEKTAEIMEIKGVPVIFVTDIEPSNTLKNVIMRYKKQKWKFGGISVTKGRDKGSITLRRLDDDYRVDFRRIKAPKEKVPFIAADGFMASVLNVERSEIKEFIKQSIKI